MRVDIDLTVSADLSKWIAGAEELGRGITPEFVEEWEDASSALFHYADQFVHIDTGRLRASGEVIVVEDKTEVGTVVMYSTPYAYEEYSRGGPHAWLALAWLEAEKHFDDAMMNGWIRTVESWR